MEKILFSIESVGLILAECYSRDDDNETGGILVGPINHKRIITDILPSTDYAERGFVTYYQSEKDVEILNCQLQEYQKIGYDFKGNFHKHPRGMNYFSGIDINTFRETLSSPNYKINNFLISCLITNTINQDFPLYCYTLSKDNNGKLNINQAEIKILPKACIEECMVCFEDGGGQDESNNTEHNCRKIEIPSASDVVRISGSGDNDSKLPGKEKRIRKSWNVFSRGGKYFSRVIRRIIHCFHKR